MGMRRVDIFLKTAPGQGDYPKSDYKLYCAGIGMPNYERIVKALESQGESVLVCRSNKSALGKFVYQTS